MAKVKVNIKKCYEVWVEDENGNRVDYQYVYGDRKAAEDMARYMKHLHEDGVMEEEVAQYR